MYVTKSSVNVVVTKNYCYRNVTENFIITLIWMFFLPSKNVIPNIVRTFRQQLGNIFNFLKKNISVRSWEISKSLLVP